MLQFRDDDDDDDDDDSSCVCNQYNQSLQLQILRAENYLFKSTTRPTLCTVSGLMQVAVIWR